MTGGLKDRYGDKGLLLKDVYFRHVVCLEKDEKGH